MDGAAIALARDNRLPVIVFSIDEPGNLIKRFARHGSRNHDPRPRSSAEIAGRDLGSNGASRLRMAENEGAGVKQTRQAWQK